MMANLGLHCSHVTSAVFFVCVFLFLFFCFCCFFHDSAHI